MDRPMIAAMTTAEIRSTRQTLDTLHHLSMWQVHVVSAAVVCATVGCAPGVIAPVQDVRRKNAAAHLHPAVARRYATLGGSSSLSLPRLGTGEWRPSLGPTRRATTSTVVNRAGIDALTSIMRGIDVAARDARPCHAQLARPTGAPSHKSCRVITYELFRSSHVRLAALSCVPLRRRTAR